MEVGQLYTFVLTLVLVGMIIGIGLVVLGKFASSSAITPDASTALNNTISAIADIPTTWLGLIVTVAILAIILVLVVRSFAGGFGGGAKR